MSSLRRRFEQNQEDCAFTVLAILPTATENILEALPVEQTLGELQRQREERLAKSSAMSEVSTADLGSAPGSIAEEDGKSLASFKSESYVHTSQFAESNAGGEQGLQPPALRTKKSKAVLWNEMKISCMRSHISYCWSSLTIHSNRTRLYSNLHSCSAHTSYPYPTQPPRTSELSCQCSIAGFTSKTRVTDKSREQRR
jgi:peroxin-3